MEVMSAEGYRFENKGFKAHGEKVSASRMESIPLFERDSEFGVQTLSRRVGNQEEDRYASFGAQNEKRLVRSGLGKTAQVATLATAELAGSAVAMMAGSAVAARVFDFPVAIYTLLARGLEIPFEVALPITRIIIGIALIIVGMKGAGVAVKRIRALF